MDYIDGNDPQIHVRYCRPDIRAADHSAAIAHDLHHQVFSFWYRSLRKAGGIRVSAARPVSRNSKLDIPVGHRIAELIDQVYFEIHRSHRRIAVPKSKMTDLSRIDIALLDRCSLLDPPAGRIVEVPH